ncbi:hypothetical protein Mycsm_01913 [Mycobacterium sp. JS623]|uniref:hypothetical protein n=1 Tax=Mycobacterium sp. JS623 TaxID=212767 RepID=UPI0002A5B293|nr:hypothetical protein [Mycobacterium sp. JS623]AGB22286.1 hypothetical protein Mycsm_01913 [Mycobacterium sp. JS623]
MSEGIRVAAVADIAEGEGIVIGQSITVASVSSPTRASDCAVGGLPERWRSTTRRLLGPRAG